MSTQRIDPKRGARRWTQFISFAFATAPIVWCVLLYSFILHWRVFHGTWPDTRTLRTTIAIELAPHESATAFLAMFLIFSFPIWAAFVAFARHYILGDWRRLGFFFIPWVVVFVLAVADPGHFIMWFFD
jgi:hypothetical protein